MIHYGLINNNSQAVSNNFESVSTLSCQCSSCCSLEFQNQDILTNSSISRSNTQEASNNNISREIVDSLIFGTQWSGRTITYSFYENDVFNGDYYGLETGVAEVSEEVKTNVREILQLLETFTELNFVEVEESDPNTFGQLRYLLSEDPAYAYAYFPNLDHRGGDIHLNPAYQDSTTTNGFENGAGEHGYAALIHETLHALGLKHPHEGVPGNDVTLDPNLDNFSTTVLTQDFTGSSPATPQIYDIAALQQLYGVGEHNQGNDVYVFGDKTDTYTLNGESFFVDTSRLKQTIWDTGGNDTLDFSGLESQSLGYLFDLNQGGQLIANSQERVRGGETYFNYGSSIAYEVVIENVIGSTSNDTIIANGAANIFGGYQLGIDSGNDTLLATDSLDTLDLSDYLESEVSQIRVDQDLIVDLGNDGSILIESYYTVPQSDRLNIQFAQNSHDLELNNPNIRSPEQPEASNNPELAIPDPNNPEINSPQTNQPGSNPGEQVIAEFGSISQLNHNEQTIALQNDFINPVVFVQPLSAQGLDPAIVRITNIDAGNDTVSFYLQEPEYLDNWHVEESFSYFVVEAGTWQLANGALLEVGTLSTNQTVANGWENISFTSDFAETPAILSQVQTDNDQQFVRTRQNQSGAEGFSVALEEEESSRDSDHGEEEIGWLAIEQGFGDWNGFTYQAVNTATNIDHQFSELDLTNFEETPNLLAAIASYNGSDSAGLRYQSNPNLNSPNLEIRIEEDQSLDSETYHVEEQISYLAITGSGQLRATPTSSTLSNVSPRDLAIINSDPINLTTNNAEDNILDEIDLSATNFSTQPELVI